MPVNIFHKFRKHDVKTGSRLLPQCMMTLDEFHQSVGHILRLARSDILQPGCQKIRGFGERSHGLVAGETDDIEIRVRLSGRIDALYLDAVAFTPCLESGKARHVDVLNALKIKRHLAAVGQFRQDAGEVIHASDIREFTGEEYSAPGCTKQGSGSFVLCNAALGRHVDLPLYLQLAEDIRRDAVAKRLGTGDRLGFIFGKQLLQLSAQGWRTATFLGHALVDQPRPRRRAIRQLPENLEDICRYVTRRNVS